MTTLALIVILAQSEPTPRTDAPPPGRLAWAIATPIVGGLGGAFLFGRLAAAASEGAPGDTRFLATLGGSVAGALIGVFGGWYLGKLAREGSEVAKAAALMLYVLSGAVIAFEGVEIVHAASECNCPILPGPW